MGKREATLEHRRRVFAAAYARHANGVEAAREAGYQGGNHALAQRATELLKHPLVKQLLHQRVEQQELSAEKVLEVLGSHMLGTMEDFIRFDGDEEPHLDLIKAKAAKRLGLLKKFKEKRVTVSVGEDKEMVSETVTYEIELYDAQAAAVHVGRVLGMFADGFGDRLRPPKPTDSMTDEELLRLYLDQRVPRGMWLASAERLHRKRIESKSVPKPGDK